MSWWAFPPRRYWGFLRHAREPHIVRWKARLQKGLEVRILSILRRFVQDESGQGLAEYGFTIALVAIGVLGAVLLLKDNLAAVLQNISNELSCIGKGW